MELRRIGLPRLTTRFIQSPRHHASTEPAPKASLPHPTEVFFQCIGPNFEPMIKPTLYGGNPPEDSWTATVFQAVASTYEGLPLLRFSHAFRSREKGAWQILDNLRADDMDLAQEVVELAESRLPTVARAIFLDGFTSTKKKRQSHIGVARAAENQKQFFTILAYAYALFEPQVVLPRLMHEMRILNNPIRLLALRAYLMIFLDAADWLAEDPQNANRVRQWRDLPDDGAGETAIREKVHPYFLLGSG